MVRTLALALVLALALAGRARADDPPAAEAPAAAQAPAVEKPADDKPAEDPKPAPKFNKRKLIHGMAMKQVVCRSIDEAKGKQGPELADAVEAVVTQHSRANYRLSALLASDPPVACFYSLSDPSKLPMGAR